MLWMVTTLGGGGAFGLGAAFGGSSLR